MTSKKIYSPLVLEHTEEIEDWLEELHIWECVTHLESKKHGPAIYLWTCSKKKVALRDIAELKNHKLLFYLKMKPHMKISSPQVFQVMLWILCVTFSVKI